MKGIVITIDGPSGSGKGTTADGVAEKLGIPHIDSGAIYRTIAYYLHKKEIDPTATDSLVAALGDFYMDFTESGHVVVDGIDVEDFIRSRENSKLVFGYSRNQLVRDKATTLQREFLAKGGVLDGRDAATVVAPHADLKIYLECDIAERARRRAKQYGITDPDEIQEIENEIQERDDSDKNNDGSLTVLPDSVIVDTSGLTVEQQIQKVYDLAIGKINEK